MTKKELEKQAIFDYTKELLDKNYKEDNTYYLNTDTDSVDSIYEHMLRAIENLEKGIHIFTKKQLIDSMALISFHYGAVKEFEKENYEELGKIVDYEIKIGHEDIEGNKIITETNTIYAYYNEKDNTYRCVEGTRFNFELEKIEGYSEEIIIHTLEFLEEDYCFGYSDNVAELMEENTR